MSDDHDDPPKQTNPAVIAGIIVGALVLLVVLLVVVLSRKGDGGREAGAPTTSAKGSPPDGREEVRRKEIAEAEGLVRNWVDANTDRKAKFLAWGPHLSKADVDEILNEAGVDAITPVLARGDTLIRVRYEDERSRPTELVLAVRGRLCEPRFGLGGDDWINSFRKWLAQTCPGVRWK